MWLSRSEEPPPLSGSQEGPGTSQDQPQISKGNNQAVTLGLEGNQSRERVYVCEEGRTRRDGWTCIHGKCAKRVCEKRVSILLVIHLFTYPINTYARP